MFGRHRCLSCNIMGDSNISKRGKTGRVSTTCDLQGVIRRKDLGERKSAESLTCRRAAEQGVASETISRFA